MYLFINSRCLIHELVRIHLSQVTTVYFFSPLNCMYTYVSTEHQISSTVKRGYPKVHLPPEPIRWLKWYAISVFIVFPFYRSVHNYIKCYILHGVLLVQVIHIGL